jgi:hypothetical protein
MPATRVTIYQDDAAAKAARTMGGTAFDFRVGRAAAPLFVGGDPFSGGWPIDSRRNEEI